MQRHGITVKKGEKSAGVRNPVAPYLKHSLLLLGIYYLSVSSSSSNKIYM